VQYVHLLPKPPPPNVSDNDAMSFALMSTALTEELLSLTDGGGGRPGGAFPTPDDDEGGGGRDGEEDAGLKDIRPEGRSERLSFVRSFVRSVERWIESQHLRTRRNEPPTLRRAADVQSTSRIRDPLAGGQHCNNVIDARCSPIRALFKSRIVMRVVRETTAGGARFVFMLLKGKSALFRLLVPRIVKIKHNETC